VQFFYQKYFVALRKLAKSDALWSLAKFVTLWKLAKFLALY